MIAGIRGNLQDISTPELAASKSNNITKILVNWENLATWAYPRGLKCPRKYNQARLPQQPNNNLRRLEFQPKHSSSLLGRTMPGQSEKQQEESRQLPRLVE